MVCIAPRPPRIIQLSSANNSMFENTVTTQPILSSPGANRMYLSTSAYPAQQQQPQQQAASVGVIRPSNSTIVLDGRPIVFASPATRLTSPPAAPALRPQPVQRISVLTSGVIISQGGDVVQSSQPPSTPIVTGNIVVSSNTSSSNSSTSTNLSSVKIQDDLCLTESQLSVVQSLFQDANR
ncbi:unnamed protein product, partial [Trichobilharzia regenti]